VGKLLRGSLGPWPGSRTGVAFLVLEGFTGPLRASQRYHLRSSFSVQEYVGSPVTDSEDQFSSTSSGMVVGKGEGPRGEESLWGLAHKEN